MRCLFAFFLIVFEVSVLYVKSGKQNVSSHKPVLKVRSELRIEKYFTDNAVLQRGKKITIRGNAIPNQEVLVSIANKNYKTALP